MSEPIDIIKAFRGEIQGAKDDVKGLTGELHQMVASMTGIRGRSSGQQIANFGNGISGNGGNNGTTNIMDIGGVPDFTDPNTRNARRNLLNVGVGAGLETLSGLSAMLPNIQEAMNIDTLGNRLRFYGNQSAMQNIGGAFAMQRALAAMGTPTSALDPAIAANSGAGMGLLPGLTNYNASGQFGGVLGGAALASNLTPGLGLQGGMQAMAGLNTARNVNMLRMIGVNVRNQQGQMNDLPDVIGQIFRILEQSAGQGNVTAQSIALSAQSGNALDSILNQYFGNDAALRQTVLSGLLQMANTGGQSLRTSGTRENAVKSGAISAPVATMAARNASEQHMLQQWSRATNEGFIGTSKLLSGLYGQLGNAAQSETLQGLQASIIGLETFSGARGGAGAMITDAMLNVGSAGLSNSFLGKLGVAGKVGAGAIAAGLTGSIVGRNMDPNYSPGTGNANYPMPVAATNSYPNANITINVTAPTGSDPWSFANQISQAMIDAARR